MISAIITLCTSLSWTTLQLSSAVFPDNPFYSRLCSHSFVIIHPAITYTWTHISSYMHILSHDQSTSLQVHSSIHFKILLPLWPYTSINDTSAIHRSYLHPADISIHLPLYFAQSSFSQTQLNATTSYTHISLYLLHCPYNHTSIHFYFTTNPPVLIDSWRIYSLTTLCQLELTLHTIYCILNSTLSPIELDLI